MRGLARVVLLGAAFAVAPALDGLGLPPVAAALATVGLGVLLAVVLAGAPTPLAVGGGALGALAHAALAPLSVALAGATLVAAAHAGRVARARSVAGAAAMATGAFFGGGAGAWVAWAFREADLGVRAAALLVAALLAAAPLLVSVDDGVATRLRALAGRASGALRRKLLRAVVLRRRAERTRDALSRPVRRRLDRAYRALTAAAAARLAGPTPAAAELDARVDAYVRSLARADRAAGRARALSECVDDLVLAELELASDDLEARADALAEVERAAG